MKKIQTLILLLLFINFSSHCQSDLTFEGIPKERVFVHLNTTFLMSGETLLYTLYCINDQNNKLSELSKIVYIEIIDENKKAIFKQKIKLTEGVGYSDFFVTPDIQSGTYKLIAYTTLMRNTNSFFTNEIFIINPFHEDQSQVIDSTSTKIKNLSITKKNDDANGQNRFLSLASQSDTFTSREKVSLKISTLLDKASYGTYSVSIKKLYPLDLPEKRTSTNDKLSSNNSAISQKSNYFFVPEFRGELITGKVISKETNTPISDLKIALSIPEKEPIFKISSTNDDGAFYFNINKDYENTIAVIQIIGDDTDELEILIPEKRPLNYDQFLFSNKYIINQDQKNMLLSKSIKNQIENSYKSVKQDSIKENKNKSLFFGKIAKDYFLDDYKRFPTLRETFVEVIENAWIAKKNGRRFLKIKRNLNAIDFELSTLLLVDGILIQDHEEIIAMDPKDIHKISIVRDQYIYGPHIFEGIISIETLDGNFRSMNKQTIQLEKPRQRKEYFSPTYTDTNDYNRIPDYRDQLLWNPMMKINSKEVLIDFYTSDEKGTFEISLEGFTHNGEPVSIKKLISVQ
ncbi:MAG: hypothetical protein HKN90_02495 [Flavobacteriaceae bacterium]|nr:hypothetical protein [Flavobacteriaceae bacterium]